MLTLVVIASIKPGMEQTFETRVQTLFAAIAAEPGCRGATWGPTETPGEYAMVERFDDWTALEAHRASPHEKQQGPGLAALFAKPLTIARFIEQRAL